MGRGRRCQDMTLFMDDDGSACQIYASKENATLQVSQLRPDFLAPPGKCVRIFPGGFNEAPAMFKYHGGILVSPSVSPKTIPAPAISEIIFGNHSSLNLSP